MSPDLYNVKSQRDRSAFIVRVEAWVLICYSSLGILMGVFSFLDIGGVDVLTELVILMIRILMVFTGYKALKASKSKSSRHSVLVVKLLILILAI